MKTTESVVEKHKTLENKYISGVNNRVVKDNKNQIIFLDKMDDKIEKNKKIIIMENIK